VSAAGGAAEGPSHTARPAISLCLVVRDEEAELPACLASVRGAVDEVVLVDTGSADRTVALAREAGAVVLTRPWDDDFAAPRNLAARRATGDWLLVLDADERLAPGAAEGLRRAAARGGFEVGLVRLHNARSRDAAPAEVVAGPGRAGTPSLLPRLVRNQGAPEWRGRIHESLGEWLRQRGGRRAAVEVDLVHYGALPSRRAALGKAERNVALLRRSVDEAPGDAGPAGYLALELLGLARFEEAEAVADAAWARLAEQPPDRCLHRLALARGMLALRREDGPSACETARVAAARGAHPDLDYLEAAGLELEGLAAAPGSSARRSALAAALAGLERAARRDAEQGPFDFLGLALPARLALHRAALLLSLGRPAEAAEPLRAVLALEPANAAAGAGLAEALLLQRRPAEALAAVERWLPGAPGAWLTAALAAEALGSPAEARLFLARVPAGVEPRHREPLAALRARLREDPP